MLSLTYQGKAQAWSFLNVSIMVDAMDEVQVRRAEVMMPQKESLLKDPAYTLPLNGEQQEVTLLEMDDVELAYGTERSEGRGKLQITSRYALRVSFPPR